MLHVFLTFGKYSRFSTVSQPPLASDGTDAAPAGTASSSGRTLWHWRAALLAVLAWIGWRHLADPEYTSIFSGITLAFHELGHILFGVFGETLAIAGGSIAQIAVPIVAAVLLHGRNDRFGAAVAGTWLSFSLSMLATYVADARAQELPLVGFTQDPEHDWYHLLARAGLLEQDLILARGLRVAAFVVLVLSLVYGTRCLLVMARSTREEGART